MVSNVAAKRHATADGNPVQQRVQTYSGRAQERHQAGTRQEGRSATPYARLYCGRDARAGVQRAMGNVSRRIRGAARRQKQQAACSSVINPPEWQVSLAFHAFFSDAR